MVDNKKQHTSVNVDALIEAASHIPHFDIFTIYQGHFISYVVVGSKAICIQHVHWMVLLFGVVSSPVSNGCSQWMSQYKLSCAELNLTPVTRCMRRIHRSGRK
jgi:hypothetical protein